MVLMKRSARQEQTGRHREQPCGHSGGRRGWNKWREWHRQVHTTVCKIAHGKLLVHTGAQLGAL